MNNTYLLSNTQSILSIPNYITTELLCKNIKNIQSSSIFVEPSKFISKDNNQININLHKTEMRNKHINSIKLNFVSKQTNDDYIFTEENIKYEIMCGYNLIFDDNFQQNKNLLTTDIILPIKYLENHHSICINIKNISNIVSFINDLILKIQYDEVDFDNEFDKLISLSQLDQLIQLNNNTYNVFRVMFGVGVKAFYEDLPKDIFNTETSNIGCKILV